MKALIVTNLSGKSAPGEHNEPHGTLQHAPIVPHPGVIRQLKLGAAGLQYQRGDLVAAIPHAELIKFFESIHPKFAEAPHRDPLVPATLAPAAPQPATPPPRRAA